MNNKPARTCAGREPRRRTVIYAMRDPEDALEVADRIAVLRRGRIVQCGPP